MTKKRFEIAKVPDASPELLEKQQTKLRQRGRLPSIGELIAYMQNGLSAAEVARMYGVNNQAIYLKLKRHGIDIKGLKCWKERKADVLSHLQMQIAEAIDNKKIQNTSLRDLATSFNIMHNAERLERGQSTQNVGLSAMLQSLQELEAAEAKLKAQIGLSVETPTEGGEPDAVQRQG